MKFPPPPDHQPPLLEIDGDWFDIESVDRENCRWHLDMTAGQVAQLSQLYAEACYWAAEYKRAVKIRGAEVLLVYKTKPHAKTTVDKEGNSKEVLVDGSDTFAEAAAAVDSEWQTWAHLEGQWNYRKNQLQGYLTSMEVKRTFLATIGGLNRAEMEAQTSVGG